MRALLILFLFALLSLCGRTQVVITSSDLPTPEGSNYVLNSVIPAPDVALPFGTIWDFSGLVISKNQGVTVMTTEESPLREHFSESTLCYSLGGGNYLFAKKTEKSFLKYGGVAKTTELFMNDPEEYLRFPLKKGQEWMDSLQSTFSSQGIRFERSGRLKGKVIGEATLLMPYGSVQNVLRISLEETLSDAYEVMGAAMVQTTTNLIECFVKAGNAEPLLTWTRVMVNDKQISSYLSFVDGSYVEGKDSEGPWNSFSIEQSADQNGARLEFISEWRGVLTMEYLDQDGITIVTEELKTKPGLMVVNIDVTLESRYLRLTSENQSIVLLCPKF
ncbi:MAG: hypothetical protein O2867_05290 [Bacteroidetes bacterium]|nr:hypothetical protein [Bacteroidota bacterium]MDA0973132.1 hypothetical protein [Bacteroidota bacterium]